MNSALQELYVQLQKHEISTAEFTAGIQDLCGISAELLPQARALIEQATTSGLLPTDTASQLLASLNASMTQGTVVMSKHDASGLPFEPTLKTTLQRPSAELIEPRSLASKPEVTAPLASTPPPYIDVGVLPVGPGSIIKDRFQLKEQIGSGGMGVVFSAVDQRKVEALDPNPMVAVKILGTDFAQHPKALMALQREARKAQELAHPNVVTVFDFDRDGDMVYMTMELLQGRSLDSFIREVRGKGVERDVAMPIIRGIAEGLAYAHRKGIVHSDLKPANIFLNKKDNSPKLLDFGIARAVPSRDTTRFAKDVFDAGSLGAYTLPYATEEMIAGSEPDPADDLYALGLMCCELLAGEHPFKRLSAGEARKQGMKPTPIKGLSKEEWKTIESCLSFDRSKRPKDAGAFLRSLNGTTNSRRGLYAASIVLLTGVVSFAFSGLRTPTAPNTTSATQNSVANVTQDTPTDNSMAREMPDAGKMEHVPVTSQGQGPTLQAAVDQALQIAVEQINGKSIDSSSTQFQGGMAVAFGPDPMQLSAASFANYVTTQSRGTVTDFRLVNQQQIDGGFAATIHANVAKWVKPQSANRLRIIVAPMRVNAPSYVIDNKRISADDIAGKIQKQMVDTLVRTNRVTTLDREFTPELDAELDLIANGRAASEDQARLNQQLVADYVLVGTIDKFEYKRYERALRMSDRVLVSHGGDAQLSLRLINTATRQVEYSGTAAFTLPETEPTTLTTSTSTDIEKRNEKLVEDIIQQLSDQSVHKIISRLFPITVLTVDGDDVVLSQGEGQVRTGTTYKVILRGKEMKDQQTGQSLGRLEKDCCTVLVTRVTPTLAYGKVATKEFDLYKVFAPGALELREPVTLIARTSSVTSNSSTKKDVVVKQNAKPESKSSSSKADNNW